MKYQFDSKEEIYDCSYCPFYDPIIIEGNVFERHPWECWINKRRLTDVLGTKPDWCPLQRVEESKEIPKKIDVFDYGKAHCPSCEMDIHGKGKLKYCYNCGQKLKWY